MKMRKLDRTDLHVSELNLDTVKFDSAAISASNVRDLIRAAGTALSPEDAGALANVTRPRTSIMEFHHV